MKHLTKAVIIFFILMALCVTTFASGTNEVVFERDNVEIIFNEKTPFTSVQREQIVSCLYGDCVYEMKAASYNLICALFGHDYIYDTVITITHKVRDANPRCLREIFEIGLCTRCDATTMTCLNSAYITCCP